MNFKTVLIVVVVITTAIQAHSQSESVPADQLVSIGFHHLFISQRGPNDASVTVVFESGSGGTSKDWEQVRLLVPSTLQTIAYDRAGVGKSEAGPLPRTMAQEVFELHELLQAFKVNGPLILVGQSTGGLLVRMYAAKYGDDVAGLVLIDPTHESGMLGSIRYGGWVRLREKARGVAIPKPQLQKSISANYDSTADYMAEEFQNIYLFSVKHPQPLKSRPLVILGAGKRNQPPGTPDAQWKELRKERDEQIQSLTGLSRNAKFILVPDSGHSIQSDNPAIVVKAIEMVIDAVRTKSTR